MMKNTHIDVDEDGAWIEMRDKKETLEFTVYVRNFGERVCINIEPEQVKELRDSLTVFLKEHK